MKTIGVVLCVGCCVLSACGRASSSQTDGYASVYPIEYQDDEPFDWYTHMQIEEIIPLEYTDSSMLGIARKALIIGDKIFFQDYKQRVVYAFDIKGNYLYCIDGIGNGPGEYTDIQDIQPSWDQQALVLNDGYKLFFYDIVTGKYLHTVGLDQKTGDSGLAVWFSSFCNPARDVYYLWTDMAEYTVYKYAGGRMEGLVKREGRQINGDKFKRNYKGETLVCPDLGEYGICHVEGDKRLYIDFGSKALPEEQKPRSADEFIGLEKKDYFRFINHVLESEDGIFVSAVGGPENTCYDIYIHKPSGRVVHGKPDESTVISLIHATAHSFYALCYPEYLPDDSPLRNDLRDYIKSDGNPLIIKFKVVNM